MEVKAAALRCQLLLILVMSVVMLLPGTNGSLLLVQRTVTRTIVLQETIGKGIKLSSSGFCPMCFVSAIILALVLFFDDINLGFGRHPEFMYLLVQIWDTEAVQLISSRQFWLAQLCEDK
ncbi:hypothetical protein STEG23_019160, partial [Scotinomys teguina]